MRRRFIFVLLFLLACSDITPEPGTIEPEPVEPGTDILQPEKPVEAPEAPESPERPEVPELPPTNPWPPADLPPAGTFRFPLGDIAAPSVEEGLQLVASGEVALEFPFWLPERSRVTDARIEFTAAQDADGSAKLGVRAVAKPGVALDKAIGERKTRSSTVWEPNAWSAGETFRTPNLARTVKEVIDHPEWEDGITFALPGVRGERIIQGEGEGAPVLVVTYEVRPDPAAYQTNITACAGLDGPYDLKPYTAIPGNAATPGSLAPDGSVYVAFYAGNPKRPVVVRYDPETDTCSEPVLITENMLREGEETSHSAPSVYVDADGHVVVTYYGGIIWQREKKMPSPYIRRTEKPGDLTSLGKEKRMRIYNFAELHGLRRKNGDLIIVGEDANGRYDVLKRDGTWGLEAARQIVAQDKTPTGAPNCPQTREATYFNRHTKMVLHEGQNGHLYAIWGYSAPYKSYERPEGMCADLRHYINDQHEVFFAYSKNDGKTWLNADSTRRVEVGKCRNGNCVGGVNHADEDFRITTLRQREHRKIWVEHDGKVHIGFIRSTWCDSGVCGDEATATHPGALMYMSFYPGRTIPEPVTIDTGEHKYVAGLRVQEGTVYLWALNVAAGKSTGTLSEFTSPDGRNFREKELTENCRRSHGDVAAPEIDSVVIVSSCERDISVYRKDF